jgi:hypothetical protein
MYIGIRESEGKRLMRSALGAAGLTDVFPLVLFGGQWPSFKLFPKHLHLTLPLENAALPHGSGTDRALGEHDLALFDVGGSLHGYMSDVTRVRPTFLSHVTH